MNIASNKGRIGGSQFFRVTTWLGVLSCLKPTYIPLATQVFRWFVSMDTFSLDRTFRQARAGSFFEHYPRHRKLISLNKRNLCCIKSWGLTVRVDKSLVVESLHKIHPVSLTWNLKMVISKRNLFVQGLIFRFHVKLQG